MSVVETVKEYPAAIAIAVAVCAAAYVLTRRSGPVKKKSPVALLPEEFQPFVLADKIRVSHDTRIFRFKLQYPEQKLGLPIGQHMYLRANIDGKDVQRAYTPISSDDDLGYFDLLIKVYFPNVHPKFPEGGKLTQHLEKMQIGDTIDAKGPIGRFEYLGNGNFRVKKGRDVYASYTAKSFGMIAGGTGITPMRQIMQAILKNPEDKTKIHLLFANQTEADILLRDELEAMTKDPRVKVWFTLDRPEADWKYSSGFISYEMVNEHMPKPEADNYILMCGPLPMINFACKPNLEKVGFKDEQMFAF